MRDEAGVVTENRIRILLVEDSEDDAFILERYLKKAGLEFELCRIDRFDEFKEKIRSGEYDLVLSDFNLPGFSGLAVVQEASAARSEIPVIILSGAVGEEAAAKVMKEGASDFIRKENPARLASAIERELAEFGNRQARKRAEKALRETLQALRLANEELKHAIDTRDDFLTAASHELRTPVTSLRLQLELARRSLARVSSVPPELTKFFRVAEEQTGRLTTLIEMVLDIALLQAGRLQFKPEWVDLHEVVSSATQRAAELLRVSGNTLEVDLDEDLSGYVDSARLEQVLAHLLDNASKYAPGVKIRIEGRRTPDEKLHLVVHDYGKGVPKEQRERIFERFERFHPVANVSGLGLGLFISRALVQAQGGRIWVESPANEGALFIVELPFSRREKKAA